MKCGMRWPVVLLAAFAIVALSDIDAALARGSAPNTMDSPGYQRALQESRKRLQQPDTAFPAASPRPRAAPRHGQRHHRHPVR